MLNKLREFFLRLLLKKINFASKTGFLIQKEADIIDIRGTFELSTENYNSFRDKGMKFSKRYIKTEMVKDMLQEIQKYVHFEDVERKDGSTYKEAILKVIKINIQEEI